MPSIRSEPPGRARAHDPRPAGQNTPAALLLRRTTARRQRVRAAPPVGLRAVSTRPDESQHAHTPPIGTTAMAPTFQAPTDLESTETSWQRRRWLTFLVAFVALLLPMVLWALASPIGSVPDEPSHAIRAAAV